MNNKYISLAIATVFVLVPAFSMAAPSTDTGMSGTNSGTLSVGAGESGTNPSAPSTGAGTSGTNPAAPSIGSGVSGTDVSSAENSNNTSNTSGNNTGSTGNGSSGYTSTGGGSYSGSSAVVLGVAVNPVNNCLGISQYMRMGMNNDANQVKSLQTFLKDTQEVDVDINGIYDEKTVEAVKTFQTRYANVILAPWGTSIPSGIVSITTLKKINQIACNQPLTLSAFELTKINSYKSGSTWTEAPTTPIVVENPVTDESLAGVSIEQTENTATVANISLSKKFWNFLKSLF